ncbi:unnamed protein product (macronuclear) [Paramecium tetraurelia]|uniref:N-acetyltransferase domain-containing protein n=1 Tax=Paramecium tetraurelia TaxID=5888 RepID=A0DAZ1_PARTE|nr:uncharacterized protein GSPATT00015115001 [Paramecium tetraurelia]CAK80208.1 unnamed protein product [Paramecium tetraurelia]|eukprot:XP_001447605.1 hypothetical protein (macronuclear) [Paramecium tetraurelia strain d4-2]
MLRTNIQDLSTLLKEKETRYTFRKLERKDVYNAQRLMINAFLSHNPVIQLLQATEEDIKVLQSIDIFDRIIQENLSYGAFEGDNLVSACLTCDLKTDMQDEGVQPTPVATEIIGIIDILLGKYVASKERDYKEVAYLNHLGTHSNYLRQSLAVVCAYLSIEECRRQGFKQLLTESWHQGTYSTFSKIFNNFEVIKEIHEIKQSEVKLISLVGQLN